MGFTPNEKKSVSKTSAYTVTNKDSIIYLSGASFPLTLPSAVGLKDKEFTIVHRGTSVTQVYALNTTGGQTIGDITSGNYKLCTNGETLVIKSDGSNYIVIDHKTETPWENIGAVVIHGTSSNPTKATTPDIDRVLARRVGDSLELQVTYGHSNPAGAAAGSGDYIFRPLVGKYAGALINTALTGAYAVALGTLPTPTNVMILNTMSGRNNNQSYHINVWVHDSTGFRMGGTAHGASSNGFGTVGTSFQTINGVTNLTYAFTVKIPIVDWQP